MGIYNPALLTLNTCRFQSCVIFSSHHFTVVCSDNSIITCMLSTEVDYL